MATGTESAAGVALFAKFGVPLGAGILGAAIIAALDPPATRRELFLQALCAGVGTMVFGPAALRTADYFFSAIDLLHATSTAYFEWAIPVYFLVGSLSWGMFGAIVKLRQLIKERAAEKIADKLS